MSPTPAPSGSKSAIYCRRIPWRCEMFSAEARAAIAATQSVLRLHTSYTVIADLRRCIAVDLMAHGSTQISAAQDVISMLRVMLLW